MDTAMIGKQQVAARTVVRAVAVFELAKGLLVLLLGCGAIFLVHKDAWDAAETVLNALQVNPDDHYAQIFLNLTNHITDTKLWAIAAGAALYCVVRFVEAYGLWCEYPWAEWFAVLAGALYIPFEVYELVRRTDLTHWTVLAINLAIVGYLLDSRLSARRAMTTP